MYIETVSSSDGYKILNKLDRNKGHIREHILIAEKAMGKPMPKDAVVHHSDENTSNNAPSNLVVCSRGHHNFLHMQIKAKKECGNPRWRKCVYCKKWSQQESLESANTRTRHFHKECKNLYQRQLYKKHTSYAVK